MEYPTVEHVQKVTVFKTRIYAQGAIETLIWLEAGAGIELGRFDSKAQGAVTADRC